MTPEEHLQFAEHLLLPPEGSKFSKRWKKNIRELMQEPKALQTITEETVHY